MVIAHNMQAMNVDRQLGIVTSDKAKSAEKLSSGYRINRSADDAAGLSISEKMRYQIRGLKRGASNIEEGIGYCQVADGALNEMHDMLQRMNELCIQAANGTLSETDRGYVDDEVQTLKAEIERVCRTTKFNEEYIFRCDDVIPEQTHDVYDLTFSGRPKDLFIYNSSYDADDLYAGVSFRGRRYSWDEISPLMYDDTTHEFREGEYSLRADDGTVLTLICEQGAKLPQVSRKFTTSADGKGIYINDDLVSWDKVKVAGNKYSFQYHGMTISYTRDEGDTFEDMMLKMTGTVWESKYETPVAAYSADAEFKFGTTYDFMNNTRIEKYLKQGNMPKYYIHAVDINQGGTIPRYDANGNFLGNEAFDGVWLEGTNDDGTPNGKVLYEMTWEDFGFDCGDDNHDWDNGSTDIWVGAGSIKDDPKATYPADNATSTSPGNSNFANYDPYTHFSFNNTNDQNEHVEFYFSVINETSKEQVIKMLDNTMIYYSTINPHNKGTLEFDNTGNSNVTSGTLTGGNPVLSLNEEYLFGRDYENGAEKVTLQTPQQMTYSGGVFKLSYSNSGSRGSVNVDFTYNASSYASTLANQQLSNYIRYNSLSSPANINLSLSSSTGSSRKITLNYKYNMSGFKNVTVDETAAQNGNYVKINGKYEVYSQYNQSHQGLQRYNLSLSGTDSKTGNRMSMEEYFKTTVFTDIAAASKVSLETTDYPTGQVTGKEVQQLAMVTRYQTPFQHEHIINPSDPEEKPEYLRIQCSSNTVDNIYIQKQKLSVYRLGLTNVGTLSALQATGCIDMVGKAISKLSSVRSAIGAYQNRLEHAYDINCNTGENTQSAESKIRDTDMANEMIRFSSKNILEQSGNSVLVQANQSNSMVLSLLSQ